MKEGEKSRKVGSTNMNERSSRSHTIFRIKIESTNRVEGDDTVVLEEDDEGKSDSGVFNIDPPDVLCVSRDTSRCFSVEPRGSGGVRASCPDWGGRSEAEGGPQYQPESYDSGTGREFLFLRFFILTLPLRLFRS